MFVIVLAGLASLAAAGLIDENHSFFKKPANDGKHWALLVAGSNTWSNYRHQADVCHAYQILHKHGIPDEQIVVMMYDDIAHNEENPTPGIIINQPNGSDVYNGVLKDYTRKEVTPKNFLNILQGKSEEMKGKGSGKVIKSGPNDHIFVNFVDHGAPGFVAFPEGEELTAKQLNGAIKSMYTEKKYAQMVVYVEACESGSMFDKLLPNNINVYATTAANAKESSYACYYDKKRETYLGDVYSVMWMQDSDKENLGTETLKQQYEITKQKTNTSHVQEYGNLTMGAEVVGQFQGNTTGMQWNKRPTTIRTPNDSVKSEDVELAILQQKMKAAISEGGVAHYSWEIRKLQQKRNNVKDVFKRIATMGTKSIEQTNRVLTERYELNNFDCYYQAYQQVKILCSSVIKVPQDPYALQQLYVLVNMCEEDISTQEILFSIHAICMPW